MNRSIRNVAKAGCIIDLQRAALYSTGEKVVINITLFIVCYTESSVDWVRGNRRQP